MWRPPLDLTATALLTLAACGGGADSQEPADFVRPVVMAGHPVALDNPQEDIVVWPIWGGAFTTGETVKMRASVLPGGTGASGLVIAGPGELEDRVTVELLADAGAWSRRSPRRPTAR
jgi:hypothetical protein